MAQGVSDHRICDLDIHRVHLPREISGNDAMEAKYNNIFAKTKNELEPQMLESVPSCCSCAAHRTHFSLLQTLCPTCLVPPVPPEQNTKLMSFFFKCHAYTCSLATSIGYIYFQCTLRKNPRSHCDPPHLIMSNPSVILECRLLDAGFRYACLGTKQAAIWEYRILATGG